ncbi:DUF4265 domain-containing protein [Streptomyces sp. NPDC058385]|uniref:DUF4265 domain-containing protein n=1 Tax=Streptomyces sp. NPDC058385 TaxID=3346473 RepID=UPI0036513DB2
MLKTFHRLGTAGEGIEQFQMVALDVPPDADLLRIRKLLEHGESKGWWPLRRAVVEPPSFSLRRAVSFCGGCWSVFECQWCRIASASCVSSSWPADGNCRIWTSEVLVLRFWPCMGTTTRRRRSRLWLRRWRRGGG